VPRAAKEGDVAQNEPGGIDALLAWRSGGRLLVGRERIALLEAVVEHKSITKAAEAAGFSYKTAWDAVNAINNLLPRPAFLTRTGGSHGGGAEVTEEGLRLIRAFRSLEEKLRRISNLIAAEGLQQEGDLLFFGLTLKLSARNAFFCEVQKLRPGPVSVEVKLRASPDLTLTAGVINASVDELGLAPGRCCVALINPASVMLARGSAGLRISARNKIRGTVIRREDEVIGSEVVLDVGGGKTMTAVVTRQGADAAGAAAGAELLAIFKASHVILATG